MDHASKSTLDVLVSKETGHGKVALLRMILEES